MKQKEGLIEQMRIMLSKRLSLKLGLLIVGVVAVTFLLLFNFLFFAGERYIKNTAYEHAEKTLVNKLLRLNDIMDETELVAHHLAESMERDLDAGAMIAHSRKAVVEHGFLTSMAFSMEPNIVPGMGAHFAVNNLRSGDTILTKREDSLDYFHTDWYEMPRDLGKACWLEAYDDRQEGVLPAKDIMTLYCCPMHDAEGRHIGSVTAGMTLKWLSEEVSHVQMLENSSVIVIGRTGNYLVHPDTAKIMKQSIFSDADPRVKDQIERTGRAMIAGDSGMAESIVDGQEALIFYRPIKRTGWSMAIVCPASDVLDIYDEFRHTVWTIIIVGLVLLLIACFLVIQRVASPLKRLSEQATRIAEGRFDETLDMGERKDSLGVLTKTLSKMQRSLSKSVNHVKTMNDKLNAQNIELAKAYELKVERDQLKTAFIRNMSHQFRTPLNIISGFTEVLMNDAQYLSEEEREAITMDMKKSLKTLNNISNKLATTMSYKEMDLKTKTTVNCNEVCREQLERLTVYHKEQVTKRLDTEVDDTMTIEVSRLGLELVLKELLDNANKFTEQGEIKIGCREVDAETIAFVVSNTGIVIPEDKRQLIFNPLDKFDSFSEGIGLGLSICRNIARQMGGDLVLDDCKDYTRFEMRLPK